ncbi:DUF1853 family protein [Acinetobacter sp.]|uniref:DUF1853 family protein n=1 Tax=Acinetobacter sp. TaxID=472 RepID=UPI0026496052|nr:DUF1853 family protein [Acinetobacter sp.]MDN5512476.1 DUF1853 family protein [Acinetobacter sp.]MDN5524315.1 DUF1853 family protein [Acinetobacter sp.]
MFILNQASHLEEPWLQFKNLLVRQLAFCVCSPNILSDTPAELVLKHAFQFHDNAIWYGHFENYRARLLYLDQHPQELEIFLQQLKSTRLGLRFEMFIWFWLLEQDYHPYQLLGHSIQKIAGPRTLGELDFLLFNTESKAIEHWEVALKYYLAERDFSLPYWYGLNRSDTLLRKLSHFSQKQFQFEDALEHKIEQRFAVLKGQLYLPIESTVSAIPNWVNLQRRLGYWGSRIPPQTSDFYRLQRQEWICPEQHISSDTAHWWSNGLYLQKDQNNFYMYRNSPLLSQKVKG